MSRKRVVFYLLLNIIVSVTTVSVVLWGWQRYFNPTNVTLVSPVTVASPPQGVATATPFALVPYQVQPGDDLPGVAQRLGVAVETLRAINNLTEDTLGVGQTIYVPAPLQPTETPTPVPPGDPAALHIVSVVAAGDVQHEYVQVQYTGEGEISLLGWQLQSEQGAAYSFPELSLHSNGAVRIHTAPGVDTVVDLFWGQDVPVWASGVQVLLVTPDGTVSDTYRIP